MSYEPLHLQDIPATAHPDLQDRYLRIGPDHVPPDILVDALTVLRAEPDPSIKTCLSIGNVCMELAKTDEHRPRADSLLEEADSYLFRAATRRTEHGRHDEHRRQLRADMMRIFIPKFRKTLVEEKPIGLEDEEALLTGLYGLIRPKRYAENLALQQGVSGKLWGEWYETMVHTLVARNNVLENEMVLHTWPSFTRHRATFNHTRKPVRKNWDFATSTAGFLVPQFTRNKIVGTTNLADANYSAPEFDSLIRVVSLREDLGMPVGRLTLETLYSEHDLELTVAKGKASDMQFRALENKGRRLDEFAGRLLARVGVQETE